MSKHLHEQHVNI